MLSVMRTGLVICFCVILSVAANSEPGKWTTQKQNVSFNQAGCAVPDPVEVTDIPSMTPPDPNALGKGVWIVCINKALEQTGNNNYYDLFLALRQRGIEWVVIKGGDGTRSWLNQIDSHVARAAHKAGVYVFASLTVFGSTSRPQIEGEMAVLRSALARCSGTSNNDALDGLIIVPADTYHAWSGRVGTLGIDSAREYCAELARYQRPAVMGVAPYADTSVNEDFPYNYFETIADSQGNRLFNVMMPLVYYHALDGDIGASDPNPANHAPAAINYILKSEYWKTTCSLPVAPVGQVAALSQTGPRRSFFRVFLNGVRNVNQSGGNRRYHGISIWAVDNMAEEDVDAIAAPFRQ